MNTVTQSKTINTSRNIVFGFILKIYQIIMPFIIRTIIIKILGMEYAGLNSLFTSILQVLNIAELGVGSALVFSMYQPIAEKNRDKICALMKLYRTYYRIIGCVIFCIGILITPFLKKLINGEVPENINLYIIYYLNLLATVMSYWMFAYKNSLFQAHQRNDIISKITIITNTILYLTQIILLIKFKNYYTYVVLIIIMQIINNIIIARKAQKMFPEFIPKGELPKDEKKHINSSIKDLFYSQLGLVVTTSVDSIIISTFLGLISLAIYQNYYYIVNALIGFFTIFYQSCRASIGTNLIVKNVEENYKDFKLISFIVLGCLAFCVSCLITMYQPFIELWVGKDNLLDLNCVYLFAIYFVIYEISYLFESYKSATGKWHKDRFRPLLTALANLIMNIILVNYIGLYGILISTIASYIFVNIPWLYKRLFLDAFENKYIKDYTKYFIKKILQMFLIILICIFVCTNINIHNLVIRLFINMCICTIISLVMYIFFNRNDSEYKRMLSIVKNIVNRKLK